VARAAHASPPRPRPAGGGIGNSDVWTATRTAGGSFVNVENAGTVNSDADDTPTAVTDDGCILYFVSKRAGGAGGSDIWNAKRGR
jgi:hypothetical protein